MLVAIGLALENRAFWANGVEITEIIDRLLRLSDRQRIGEPRVGRTLGSKNRAAGHSGMT